MQPVAFLSITIKSAAIKRTSIFLYANSYFKNNNQDLYKVRVSPE